MDGESIEAGNSAVGRTAQSGDVIVESNRRHTIDLGLVMPHDKNGPIAGEKGMRVFFGTIHDNGIVGAPQPSLNLPPSIWRGCLEMKAIQQMMSDQHLRVVGTVA